MAISVVINTYNASRFLSKVLDTVKDFDEIVVCDMESTDNTVEIARAHGARVVTFPKKNYNHCEPARNFAISQARSKWVLVIDDDEMVTDDLRAYLYKFTIKAEKEPDIKGVYIPRCNYIIDRFRQSKYPDYQMRFFEKGFVNWPPEIHSEPEIDGNVTKIPANRRNLALIHIPPTVDGMLERMNRYSTIEKINGQGTKVNLMNIACVPICNFLNTFFIKGAFRMGVPGFIAAANTAAGEFYRLAKIYEDNMRHKIAGGAYGDLPDTIAEEKIKLLREEVSLYKLEGGSK